MGKSYYVVGEAEEGIAQAVTFAQNELKIDGTDNPDLIVLRYQHFSVENARGLTSVAVTAPLREHKMIIVSAARLFHEAQNALLKLFEEPPPDITLVLVVPVKGVLLPTLRSRLMELPVSRPYEISDLAREFLKGRPDEREKLISKLIDRSKSDKDEEKQAARGDAVRLAEDLLRVAAVARESQKSSPDEKDLRLLINDLSHLLPLLHTRSAPLKLIFEHLLVVIPKDLHKATV